MTIRRARDCDENAETVQNVPNFKNNLTNMAGKRYNNQEGRRDHEKGHQDMRDSLREL